MKTPVLLDAWAKAAMALKDCKFDAVELPGDLYGLEIYVPCPDSGKYNCVLEFAEALGFDWMNDCPDEIDGQLYDYLGRITDSRYWFDLFCKMSDWHDHSRLMK